MDHMTDVFGVHPGSPGHMGYSLEGSLGVPEPPPPSPPAGEEVNQLQWLSDPPGGGREVIAHQT